MQFGSRTMTTKQTAMCAAALVGAVAISACGGRSRGVGSIEHTSSALAATFARTEDVSISSQNGGNGVTTTAEELMVWNLTGSQGYSEEALIRFGNLSLPAGATVTGASLGLTF